MNGMYRTGFFQKVMYASVSIIVLCIAMDMVRSTIIPLVPWLIGGAIFFLVCVYIWNRLRHG
jgi:hypothetical protein